MKSFWQDYWYRVKRALPAMVLCVFILLLAVATAELLVVLLALITGLVGTLLVIAISLVFFAVCVWQGYILSDIWDDRVKK